MNEGDIRRMIIKLLILGALEEIFVQMKRAGAGSGNISVYIQVYKNAVKIEKGKVRVFISQGLDHDDPHFLKEKEPKKVEAPPTKALVMPAAKTDAEMAMLMGGGHREQASMEHDSSQEEEKQSQKEHMKHELRH